MGGVRDYNVWGKTPEKMKKSRNFTFFKFESFHIILNENLMGISFLKTVFINTT